jgi:hypothetical protein
MFLCGDAPAVKVDELKVGVKTGLVIEKNCVFDVPPPGVGFTTVTNAVPAAATSEALMVAVSLSLFWKEVERELPFQFTTAPCTKPVPSTVNVNPALPGALLSGKSARWMWGTGFIAAGVRRKPMYPGFPGTKALPTI